jgi:hypothetical protein
MKTHCLPVVAALMLAALSCPAMAQSSAPAASVAASSARPSKPGPRQLTPTEMRENASPPGDLRPEHPVVPQISIPLGKTAPPRVKSQPHAVPRSKAASSTGGVDDAAARCEAQSDEQAGAKCLGKLSRESRNRPPG